MLGAYINNAAALSTIVPKIAPTIPHDSTAAAPFVFFPLEPEDGELEDLGEPLLVVWWADEFVLDGGAAVARDATLLHCAAALAFVSLALNGKYVTPPWLSS